MIAFIAAGIPLIILGTWIFYFIIHSDEED